VLPFGRCGGRGGGSFNFKISASINQSFLLRKIVSVCVGGGGGVVKKKLDPHRAIKLVSMEILLLVKVLRGTSLYLQKRSSTDKT
jgi:hypothetical protein